MTPRPLSVWCKGGEHLECAAAGGPVPVLLPWRHAPAFDLDGPYRVRQARRHPSSATARGQAEEPEHHGRTPEPTASDHHALSAQDHPQGGCPVLRSDAGRPRPVLHRLLLPYLHPTTREDSVTTATARPNPKHPAPYSAEILTVLEALVHAERRRLGREVTVFDPLAGVGRIHQLHREGSVSTIGMELEPEWAACHERTVQGDAILWMENSPQWDGTRYDLVVSSPPYGNRFSDSHQAGDDSTRRSYTHDLGRQLTEGNSGSMPWGPRYWAWCARLYRALPNVLADDGLLLWNVSDFVRHKATVPAVLWHRGALYGAGFVDDKPPRLVETRRMGYGAHREARAPSETVLRMRFPRG